MTIGVALAKSPKAIPEFVTWWMETAPTTCTWSLRSSRLVTIDFVSWSAPIPASATEPRLSHCGQLAPSCRSAAEIGVRPSVVEPTRMSAARDESRSVNRAPGGAGSRCTALPRAAPRGAPRRSACRSSCRSRTSLRRCASAPRRSRPFRRSCPPPCARNRASPPRAAATVSPRAIGRPPHSRGLLPRERRRGPSTPHRAGRRRVRFSRRGTHAVARTWKPLPCRESSFVVRSGRLRLGALLRRRLVDERECRVQEGAHPPHFRQQPVVVRARSPRDRSGLGARLLDDQVRLPPGLLFERDCSLFGRDECRAQKRLELAIPNEIRLELLDLVGEICALAPDVFEARDDLVQQPVDSRPLVAPDDALRRFEMSDFNRSESHGLPLSVQAVGDAQDDLQEDVEKCHADHG